MSTALARTIRGLLRERALTLSSIVLLALGITSLSSGASILAVFLVDPTPFADSSRLVRIWGSSPNAQQRGALSYLDIEQLRRSSMPGLTAFAGHRSTVTLPPDRIEPVASASIDPELFTAVGVQPIVGRGFSAVESRAGSVEVCLVSEGLWRRAFSGDGFSPGRVVRVDGRECVVLGLLPESFDFPEVSTELWFPIRQGPFSALVSKDSKSFGAIGKLEEGAEISLVDQQLSAAMRGRYEQVDPRERTQAWVEPLDAVYLRLVGGPLHFLAGGVLLTFLATALNLALLRMVSAAARGRGTAIRFALGASRRRVVGKLALEAALLAAFAALLSLPFSWACLHVMVDATGLNGVKEELGLDAPSVLASCLVGIGMTILVSLPTLAIGKAPMPFLRGGAGMTLKPWRRIAVVQVSLAVVLVFAALSFLANYWSLGRVELGFDPRGLLASEILLPSQSYPAEEEDPETWVHNHQAVRAMLDEVRSRPGLAASTVGMVHPTAVGWMRPYTVRGGSGDGAPPRIRVRVVADRYFEITGIPVLSGRGIGKQDVQGAVPVAVINEAAKRKIFHEEDPVGRTIEIMGSERQIVGVVGDVPFLGLEESHVPAIYTSYFQTPTGWFFLITRPGASAGRIDGEAAAAVHVVDPGLSVPKLRAVSEPLTSSLDLLRSGVLLATLTAMIIVVLAFLGVYGLMRASVLSWRRELAIRAALGGTRSTAVRLALVRSAGIFWWGALLGLGLVYLGEGLLRSIVESVPVSPGSWVLATVVCGVACLLASTGPLLLVWRLDPVEVLRS